MAETPESIILYGHWCSSAIWRVRAALMYKEIAFEEVLVDIVAKNSDYQEYQKSLNPMGFVPALMLPAYGKKVFW